ncbi:MAG: hypothetical protein KAY24_19350 [Candidatus Eisenbacteria sp.]|nr:hypothetical protein [Candidatus Eisenbacteria bacterium]
MVSKADESNQVSAPDEPNQVSARVRKLEGKLAELTQANQILVERLTEAADAGSDPTGTAGKEIQLKTGIHELTAALDLAMQVLEMSNQELGRARKEAQAARRTQEEFLLNISHEIRTPLNGILGMIDLVLRSDLRGEQRECLEIAQSSGKELLTIICSLLDFSKIERGELLLDPAPFSIRNQVSAVIQAMAVQAREKGLDLSHHVVPEVPEMVVGDAGLLQQLLTHLVGNAIKFTPHGRVEVRVEPAGPAPGDGMTLRFMVRDTGVGIPAEKQEIIFKAFTQADGSMTRQYGGMGLGLTIAASLTKIMGGKIWLESQPGQGCTFFFTARFNPASVAAKKK